MTKRILIIFGFIVLMVIFAEIISLLQLRASLTSNAEYWRDRSAQAGELTYVALGDSAAQGIGASRPENGYVGLLATRLEEKTGKTIRVVNLSATGARIKDVTEKQIPQLKDYDADFITIEIGANDVVHFDEARFNTDYRQLAKLLPKNTVISNMPNFGGRIERSDEVIIANQIISEAGAENSLQVADLYAVTRSRESLFGYAADFFHPNNKGYRNWADAFWDGLKRL